MCGANVLNARSVGAVGAAEFKHFNAVKNGDRITLDDRFDNEPIRYWLNLPGDATRDELIEAWPDYSPGVGLFFKSGVIRSARVKLASPTDQEFWKTLIVVNKPEDDPEDKDGSYAQELRIPDGTLTLTVDDRRPLQQAIKMAGTSLKTLCIPEGTYHLGVPNWYQKIMGNPPHAKIQRTKSPRAAT
jgi:hypothetical protein